MSDIVDRLARPPVDVPPAEQELDRIDARAEILKLRSSLFRVQNWLQDAHLVLEKSITETVEALDD